ncbi:MAG: hypothetical protein PVJ67_06285 [Candidatus Pacearchaeota archaeon]|jgi:hypothetical protein
MKNKEKIKLLSICKGEYRSEYSFQKNTNSIITIRDILIDLGFEEPEIVHYFDDIFDNQNLEKYNQETSGFWTKDYSVNIIFFEKEINLIFNYNKDNQEKISKAINKFTLEE